MSEITLINWLKAFPFLSEKVNSSNLEEIFSNGFYFGKIFQTHNIFQEMKFLKDSNEKKDIFNNYIFLKKQFRKNISVPAHVLPLLHRACAQVCEAGTHAALRDLLPLSPQRRLMPRPLPQSVRYLCCCLHRRCFFRRRSRQAMLPSARS